MSVKEELKKVMEELKKEKGLNVTREEVEKMKAEMARCRKYKTNTEKIVEFIEDADKIYKDGAVNGITTGIKCIDEAIGMVKKNELMILGGGSGAGKSLIATNIMAKLIKEGKNVIYVGLEMGFNATFERLASIIYHINPGFFRGKFKSKEAIEKAYVDLLDFCQWAKSNNHWQILGFNEFESPTTENIMATCKAIAKINKWERVDLIIIDYLQYIPSLPNKSEYETANDSIQRLKTFVVGEEIPVLALSSLNSDGSIKGTTNIRYTGDFVLMVNPVENSEDRILAVVKNRFGKFTNTKVAYTKFLEVEERSQV